MKEEIVRQFVRQISGINSESPVKSTSPEGMTQLPKLGVVGSSPIYRSQQIAPDFFAKAP
ncbi:MAG: hypothetical protein WCJ95_21305 [Mariniphaga sp.]